MNTLYQMDGHKIIGSRHKSSGIPCQDAFSFAQKDDNFFMAISDGCSGDGEDLTEKGSEILVQSARDFWEKQKFSGEPDDLGQEIWNHALVECKKQNLSLYDLAATLILAYSTVDGIRVIVWGDGVFSWQYKNSDISAKSVQWAFNHPPYLAYRDDPLAKNKMFLMMDETSGVIHQISKSSSRFVSIQKGFDGLEWLIPWRNEKNQPLEMVSLFTDGVEQVPDQKPLKIIKFLVSDKATGPFVKRVVRKLAEKFDGYKSPMDDLSMVATKIHWVES